MSIWGKIIGGAAGLALGGPLGALVGTAAGHAVDKIALNYGDASIDEEASKQKIAFTIGVIVLSAKMAKADGVVTKNEIAAFRKIFYISEKEIKNVGRVWDLARRDVAGFEIYARQIEKLFNPQSPVLEELLGSLIYIAQADGVVNPEEIDYLEKVAKIFGFDEVQFRRLLAIYNVSKADDPYSILGVNQSASDEEVKLAYRQLTLENHPDKLVASGMPEEFVRQATEKMATVNVAYSDIIQQRAEN
ncbi:MAG: TerB family tellurite resistance protein [Pseudomonadota bacterium]|nr:TerB family tellurite resistance protein [Pseudomonadota bacterium]